MQIFLLSQKNAVKPSDLPEFRRGAIAEVLRHVAVLPALGVLALLQHEGHDPPALGWRDQVPSFLLARRRLLQKRGNFVFALHFSLRKCFFLLHKFANFWMALCDPGCGRCCRMRQDAAGFGRIRQDFVKFKFRQSLANSCHLPVNITILAIVRTKSATSRQHLLDYRQHFINIFRVRKHF